VKNLPQSVAQIEDRLVQGNAKADQQKHLKHQPFDEPQDCLISKYHQLGFPGSLPGFCLDQ
jgi:hypothetical protein